MGNAKKVAVYSVRIDCGGCERTLAKALAKINGVEMFVIDRNTDTLQVRGEIDENEVLKKLKKKKKRRLIQLISVKEEDDINKTPPHHHETTEEEEEEEEEKQEAVEMISPRAINDDDLYARCDHDHVIAYEYDQNALRNSVDDRLMMFNDENPNSCSVM